MMRLASKRILYHGTSIKNLRKILGQGLVANPKIRSWQDDPNESFWTVSRQSYPGIYLTSNLMTARAAHKNPDEDGVIVVVQVETKTLVPDEDDLVFWIKASLDSYFGKGILVTESNFHYIFIDAALGRTEKLVEVAGNLIESWLKRNSKLSDRTKQALKDALQDDVAKLLEKYVLMQTAYLAKRYRAGEEKMDSFMYRVKAELEENGLSLESIPTVEKSKREFRGEFDRIIRRLGKVVQAIASHDPTYMRVDSARHTGDIGYTGANKIVAIISYPERRKDFSKPNVITVHYLSDKAALNRTLADYKRQVGKYVIKRAATGARAAKIAARICG